MHATKDIQKGITGLLRYTGSHRVGNWNFEICCTSYSFKSREEFEEVREDLSQCLEKYSMGQTI